MEESHPLGLLSFWEQTIHDSSRGVMEILPDSANWIAESSKTLRLLLDASAARGESQEANFVALLTSLNAVQLDNIETAALTQMDDTTDALLSPLTGLYAFLSVVSERGCNSMAQGSRKFLDISVGGSTLYKS